jgi:hypothetical protein
VAGFKQLAADGCADQACPADDQYLHVCLLGLIETLFDKIPN